MLALSTGDSKEVRERIADVLQGIVAQRLVARKEDQGRILVSEVLIVTGTVREALKRPESNPPLKDLIEKGTHPYGMQTFEMHLKHLLAQGVIDIETARGAVGF
jgi:twitching motility protein PilT